MSLSYQVVHRSINARYLLAIYTAYNYDVHVICDSEPLTSSLKTSMRDKTPVVVLANGAPHGHVLLDSYI